MPEQSGAMPEPPGQQQKRVLSIQSHVVHGYVGNKACVFPLQLLGYETDYVCSVQFSNHTGYKSWRGTVTTAEQLWDVVEGLQQNGLLTYTHLITGYIGSVGLLQVIRRVVLTLRQHNPGLTYVCDPVLGDDGRLYLPAEMVPLYREELVPLASVLTPNQFEAEQLTGLAIRSEQDALRACRQLLAQGPQTVVITSFKGSGAKEVLTVIACTSLPQSAGSWQSLKLEIPRLDAAFTGTGDLMAALLLARLDQLPHDLKAAVELATASLQGIVAATHAAAAAAAQPGDPLPKVMRSRELRLIPNQRLISEPSVELRAQELPSTADGA